MLNHRLTRPRKLGFLGSLAALNSPTLHNFQSNIVIQHLLPISSLDVTCTFVKKESSNRKRIWLDVATPWRECSSHCHPPARPCHAVRNLLPILMVAE